MKKFLKKSLSVFLAFCIVFSVSAVSFAVHEKGKTPVILIPGFGQSETTVCDNDGNYLGDISTFSLAGLETKTLVKNVIKDLLVPLGASAITRSDKELSAAVKKFMHELFKPFELNDDGSAVYNKKVRRFEKPYSELSEEEQEIIYSIVSRDGLSAYDSVRYYYTYDSFGSVKDAADGLHDYLHNIVLAQTKAEKVNLVPISQGGAVLVQYLASYPEDYKYIKKIVNMIPAFDGSQIVGDILTDNVRIYDVERLHREILPAILDGDLAYELSIALRLALSSKTLEKVLRTALEEAKDMLAKKSSMMWALCPSGSYEKARDLLLSDEKYSAVRAETEAFSKARKALPETLQKLKESGVYIHIIASYDMGYFMAPLFGCYKEDADNLLSPSSSALGTVSAAFGETLGDSYTSPHTYCKEETHNHISPDNKLDASTGFFPENTWYFKSVSHMGMNGREDVKNFAAELVMDDDVFDIYSFPGHTQFTDPRDNIAESVLSSNGKRIYHYDKDGNYLFGESVPTEEKGFSFWKVLYTAFNVAFSVLSKLGFSK